MATKFVKGSPTVDRFFDVNVELKIITEFKSLIEDRGEEEAGKIMWAIYMSEDPASALVGMDPAERRSNISKNYLMNENFDWSVLDRTISAYRRHAMGTKKRQYAEYLQMMDERHSYLRTLSYEDVSPKEAKEIDSLIKGSKAIWDELEKIEKEYLTESETSGRVRGDKQLSALEMGQI
jgi:hypothetical protein